MYFDKTHSKKDIIHIFNSLSVYPDKKLSKREIIESFDDLVKDVKFIPNISNLTELIKFFNEPSPNKKLPIDERSQIMLKSKKIIKYCKNHYYLESANYNTHDEVIADCIAIHQFGGIPSVRRACFLFNKNPNDHRIINPIIPEEVQKELNEKKKIKKTYYKGLTADRREHILTFD